ncbi:nuclear transport factor 2 family protein [Exilibacterium tricleocarpae]|uniref:Nuclear transport factor 2 family protein n=1 Tax=Exilibacterium tricleocarpae TaxID=2591008 RepID=A0A545TSF4_9GAMM|nr:nuclear transport factor 2 family protein [Exilibacterium tricleocarpae]TQV80071.1 nuclear transport factor 2 family protein [Exilibacterium tricleocarpae]
MTDVVERFKRYYEIYDPDTLDDLDAVYSDDIEFRDPIHTLSGRIEVKAYLRDMARNLNSCRFFYLDEQVMPGVAFIKWNMHFSHPKLAGGKEVMVRGITEVRFNERIYYHEDFYDMGAMVYEHVPLLGRLVQWLRRRLAP